MQLIKAIVHQARRYSADPAVAFAGGVATFSALMGQTSAVAEVLRRLGLRAGQYVVLDVRNPIHHLALIYALALLGIRSASVGSTFTAQFAGPRPDLFVTDRDDLAPSDLNVRRLDDRWFMFDAAAPVDYGALMAMPGFPNPDDIFRYVFSSGTTGRPKCVAVTNRVMQTRIAHFMLSLARRSSAGAELNLMGFSTMPGLMAPLYTHSVGALLCYPGNAVEALQMVALFNVNAVNGAVVQIQGLMQALGSAPPPASLKSVGIAAAKVPPRLLQEVRARLCSHVISAYGSTELGALSFGTAEDLERGDGATGHPMPWARIEIVDDEGKVLPPGQDGTIRAQTDELAVYVDDAGQPTEMLQDGWFYPGDYGRIEADGLLVITGRTSEIINRGGVIVAPDFIEEVLRLEPSVRDVAVVGAPTDTGIDEIWVAVIADAPVDTDALMRFAKQRLNERAPDRIVQVDAFPRAQHGKIMRNVLRDRLRAMPG